MTSNVRSFCPIIGSADKVERAFVADPRRWLPSDRIQADGTLQMVVRAGALSRRVRLEFGDPWHNAATTWRRLQWDPVSGDGEPASVDRWLPSLDAELGLHHQPRHRRLTLVLDGRYAPPGGQLGAAIDAAGLRRLAQATVDRFLIDIAAGLTAESLLVRNGNAPTKRIPTAERSARPVRSLH